MLRLLIFVLLAFYQAIVYNTVNANNLPVGIGNSDERTIPYAGPDITICYSDLPLKIEGLPTTLISRIETASWLPSPTGSSVGSKLTIPAGTPSGVYTFTFEINNSVSGKATDNIEVTIIAPPVANITFPPIPFPIPYNVNMTDSDIINLLSESPQTGYSSTWSIISGQGTINQLGILTGLASKEPVLANGVGTTIVKYTVIDNFHVCKPAADSIKIVNRVVNTPDAGPDTTIFTTDLPFEIVGLPTSLFPGIETASWSFNPIGSSVGNKLTIPIGTRPDTYTFTFEINNAIVGRMTDVVVITISNPTPTALSTDMYINEEYLLHPSPSSDYVTIPSNWEKDQLRVTSINSDISYSIGSGTIFNVRHLASGVYFLHNTTKNMRAKFVKN